jgi:pimeloyl-ACP methyl ester carboxylesterase
MPYVERDGVRVWFEEHGRGAAVLLTHGYGATSRMWEPQWQGLGERLRLIAWDLRGHGRSDAPEDDSLYSEAAAVGDMAAILDACGVGEAVVGGLSLGGYLSLAFHLAHPGRTRALMLFDTGPGYRSEEGRRRWNEMAGALARGLDERGLAALGGGAEVRMAEHRSTRGLALAARGILAQRDARVIDSLPAIGVPALVLWGGRDEAFVKPGEYMAAKIPGATRVVLPNAGHAANLDQTQAFNAALTSFVESVPA